MTAGAGATSGARARAWPPAPVGSRAGLGRRRCRALRLRCGLLGRGGGLLRLGLRCGSKGGSGLLHDRGHGCRGRFLRRRVGRAGAGVSATGAGVEAGALFFGTGRRYRRGSGCGLLRDRCGSRCLRPAPSPRARAPVRARAARQPGPARVRARASVPRAPARVRAGPSRRPPAASPRGACRDGAAPRAALPRCRPNPRRKCSCNDSRTHTRFVSERYVRRGIARAGGWPRGAGRGGRGLCWAP